MKLFRFLSKILFILILFTLILWLIILATLQTEKGQEWAVNKMTSYFEHMTGAQIQVKKFHFSFPLNLVLEDVAISQDSRPILAIQNFEICCAYTQLLQGRMIFSSVQASDIDIFQLPASSASPMEESSLPWETPPLPFYVKLDNIDIQRLKIRPEVVDALHLSKEIEQVVKEASFNLNGVISNNPFKSALTAHLLITAKSQATDLSSFSLGLDTQNHRLSLSFHFNQFPLQILQPDLLSDLKGHFALYASAPVSTWQSLVQDSSSKDLPIEGHFKLTLNSTVENTDTLSALIGSETTLRSHYLLKSKNAIDLTDFKIENPHLLLTGDASLTDQMIQQGHFQGEINHLEHFQTWIGKEIQGQLTFEGDAKGSWLEPSLLLRLNSPRLLAAQHTFENIRSTLEIEPQTKMLKGSVQLSLDYQGIPCKAATSFNLNDNDKKLNLSSLQAEVLHSHLQGKVSCLIPEFIWEGLLEIDVSDFQDFSHVLATPIDGAGKMKLQLTGLRDDNHSLKQGIQGELVGHSLHWKEVQAQHLTLYFDIDPLKIEFTAHEIQTPTLHLQELAGSTFIQPSQSFWPFRLKGKGVWNKDLLFNIEGNWHSLQDTLQVQLQHLSGGFGPYPFELKQPVHFTQHPDKIKLTGLWLRWGEGEIQADLQQNHQNISAQFKTNAVPSELFHLVAPDLPLAGKTTWQGHLEGTIDQPKGQFQIDLHNIQIAEDIFASKPFIAGRLLLNLDEKGIQLKSELSGVGRTPLLIAGQLPFRLSLSPFHFQKDPQLPFHLALNAEGDLDPYLHLFYNDIANLSGHAKIALVLSGEMNHPQIKGQVDLVNGAYESLSTGALYHNIQAHLEGNGSQIKLTQFSAQDSKNGRISATGLIHWDADKQFPFEFQIHPSHIFILDSDYVDISASGRLSLIGNMKKSKLQGELTVDRANIHLEETLPRQIKNIDIKYINVAKGESLPNYAEKNEANSTLELEVKLNAPQNVSIQDKHLKSEWKGALLITGTPENPLLNGDLRIAQGEYNFNGKVFQLSHGNIHFAGPVGKKTSLYVVARKDIDRITAEIIVKGPVTKPAISFRSNPPLSQREVLSYILFNRGISDITSDQGEQLSQSFMSLNTSDQTKSSDDVLSRLRNKIGIDHLDFTTGNSENKDFGLQVGKHITENVMVTVNQGMTSLSPIIAVEAKLHKNLKAQAEAGVAEDSPIRMSIKWKKDY